VVAKDSKFHPDCFNCLICKTPLGGKPFIEKDGKFYCDNDYYNAFNPRCGKCEQVIKGQYVSALGQTWHPEHFTCTICSEPFVGNQFHKRDNKPYCEKHFEENFAEKCAKCNEVIKGQVFEALDQKFHLECFVCAVGDHKIGEGVSFHVHDEKVYCPPHFENLFLQKCEGCSQTIKGQFLSVMGAHFHPECWLCTDCKRVLSSSDCTQKNNKFYCQACSKNAPQAPSSSSVSSSSNPSAAQSSAKIPVAKPEETKPVSPSVPYFTYDALKAGNPPGVNPLKKEEYLSDDVFLKMFKMDKPAFAALPEWKKKRLKTKLSLF